MLTCQYVKAIIQGDILARHTSVPTHLFLNVPSQNDMQLNTLNSTIYYHNTALNTPTVDAAAGTYANNIITTYAKNDNMFYEATLPRRRRL